MKYQKFGNLSLFISYYWQKTFNSLSISCKWKLNVYIIITCSDYWYMEVIEILCKIIVAFNIFLWIFTFTELLLLHFYSRNTMTKPASIYIYIYIYIFKILTRKNNDLWQLVSYFYFSSHIKYYNKLLLQKYFIKFSY